jgi:hypothetical protein
MGTRRRGAMDRNIDVAPATDPLSQGAGDSWDLLHHALDLGRDTLDLLQVIARHLDAERTLDARRQHVDAITNGRNPDVGEAWHPHDLVQFGEERLRRYAGAPLGARLKLHHRFDHFERRGIRGGICAADLAVDTPHLRHRRDEAVGLLKYLRRLSDGDSWKGGRHVQQIPFVERRQELGAQS